MLTISKNNSLLFFNILCYVKVTKGADSTKSCFLKDHTF